MSGQGSEDTKMGSLEDTKMRSSGPTSQPLNFSTSSRLTSHILGITLFSLLTFLYGCQLPILTPKDAVINRTNPNFLKDAGVDEKTNPHKEDDKCGVCHKASTEVLTKENPAENEVGQRRQMTTDLVDLCSRCHKASIEAGEHRVGMPTRLNRENLPLDHQGNMTCATTCHNVHTKDPGLEKNILRMPFDTLCLSCHDV